MNFYERDEQRRKIFAENLSRIRYQAGYSQGQFADMLDICKSQLQRYEWGVNEPRITRVQRMADCLNVDIRQLLMTEQEWKEIEEKSHEH